jgi:hypothetical protein
MKNEIVTLFLLAVLVRSVEAATYYVDGNSASSQGTSTNPFSTVQECLNIVQPGDTCLIRGGWYSESLTLKNSGTSGSRVIVKNYGEETVNISGSNVIYSNGGVHFVTFEGLSLFGKIDLNDNNYFTLRNCYVEGYADFKGHDILVENCEFNGKRQHSNGIRDAYGSHNNIYRNNIVHGYTYRGLWTMHNTDNILFEGNTVFDIGDQGIDCDGYAKAVHRCRVIGNTIYHVVYMGPESDIRAGIQLENAMDSVVDGNLIYDTEGSGIHVLHYGPVNHDKDYTHDYANTVISNNIIYNARGYGSGAWGAAISGGSANGIKVYGNTLYDSNRPISLQTFCSFCNSGSDGYCRDWEIKNNIFSDTGHGCEFKLPGDGGGLDMSHNIFHNAGTPCGSNAITKDPQFVNKTNHDFHPESTSPAIDKGVPIPEWTEDFDGNTRPAGSGYDVGAFEDGATGSFCGDGVCSATETCSTCIADCGKCSDTTPPASPQNLRFLR